jgi:hypothetical protein
MISEQPVAPPTAISRRPFLGIGTGRCGTLSLTRIVEACANTWVAHENPAFRSPWSERDESAMEAFVQHAHWGRRDGLCVGDVALYWLPHVEHIREALPDLAVICLQRDKAATVASLERKCPGYTLLRPQDRRHNPEWWDLLPEIDAPTTRDAWSRYYDFYYEQVAAMEGVLHVRTEDLDQDATVLRILDHLGIPEEDRVLLTERRHNTTETTVVSTSRRQDAYR